MIYHFKYTLINFIVNFLVVIDSTQRPKAETGKFECVYRQLKTPVNQKKLVLRGHKLPLDYFKCEKTVSEDEKVT